MGGIEDISEAESPALSCAMRYGGSAASSPDLSCVCCRDGAQDLLLAPAAGALASTSCEAAAIDGSGPDSNCTK